MRRLLQTILQSSLLALALSGCASTYIQRSEGVPSRIQLDEVQGAINKAEQALIDNQPQVALDWMRAATRLKGMPSVERSKVQRLLEISADRFIKAVSEGTEAAEILSEVLDLDLPRQIAVTGAIAGAGMYLERGEFQECVKLIKRVDKRFPSHHLRPEAGRLLLEAGMSLSKLDSGWLDSHRDNAFGALEYVSVNYPSTKGGELALRRLGEMYEESEHWGFAIARHEELTQNYPNSPLVPYSLARIPHLRLASIESPEYDRKAIASAHTDLGRWLQDYQGHEATEQVRYDLRDALIRLSESDLGIADFHVTVKNHFGARYHAKRAMEEARQAKDPGRVARAQAILDILPTDEEQP